MPITLWLVSPKVEPRMTSSRPRKLLNLTNASRKNAVFRSFSRNKEHHVSITSSHYALRPACKPGIGLIRECELGIVGHGQPQDVVSPGESVVVRIVEIDPEQKRMSLSLRQVTFDEEASWRKRKQENAEGT